MIETTLVWRLRRRVVAATTQVRLLVWTFSLTAPCATRSQGAAPRHLLALHTMQPSKDALAEWSKAVAKGAIPQGRGFGPPRDHFCSRAGSRTPFP